MLRTAADVYACILFYSVSPVTDVKMLYRKPAVKQNVNPTNERQPVLELEEALNILYNQVIKLNTNEQRAYIFRCYLGLFRQMGAANIEVNMAAITAHLLSLPANARFHNSYNDTLYIRSSVVHLLKNVGKMLGETAQGQAVNDLVSEYLLKYDPESEESVSHHSITCALYQISNILSDLGAASISLRDSLDKGLVHVLYHPSDAVNLALSWTMKTFCITNPSITAGFIDQLLNILQKDHATIISDKADVLHRFVGTGRVLSAIISAIAFNPLYVPYEHSARAFGFSIQLLKQSNSCKEFRVQCSQLEVAWNIISALLTIGPTFVQAHTSQLFLSWKSIFGKPTKDTSGERPEEEILQQIIIKSCALNAVLSFLDNNAAELVTQDVAKRFAVFINNAGSFISNLPRYYNSPVMATKIADHELMLRKRLFQCCVKLSPRSAYENSHINLIDMAIETFGQDFERYLSKFQIAPSGSEEAILNPTLEIPLHTSYLKNYHIRVCDHLPMDDRSIGTFFDSSNELKEFEDFVSFLDYLSVLLTLIGEPVLAQVV